MTAGLKILIIEDDLILSANLEENLVELGYQVIGTPTNDKDAIILFNKHLPDMLLVDIELKDSRLNGIEIVALLKEIRELPVIYLTSYDDEWIREKAKKTDPSAYLIKPASKSQVDITIDFAMHSFYQKKAIGQSRSLVCPLYSSEGYYFIKDGEKYVKLTEHDVLAMQGNGSYTSIYTPYKKYIISGYLQRIAEQFNIRSLKKCHRSYYVNIHKIQAFTNYEMMISMEDQLVSIPISSSFREEIFTYLNKIKSE